jgi:hypothetical protein
VEKIRTGINPEPKGSNHPEGTLFNMSVPPRTSVESVIHPASGKFIVFDVEVPAQKLTKTQLARPVFALGIPGFPTIEEVEAAARSIPAFLIGVKLAPSFKDLCRQATLATSIAAISRRVGDIYVRSRQPDYSAGHIFSGQLFAVEAWGEAT